MSRRLLILTMLVTLARADGVRQAGDPAGPARSGSAPRDGSTGVTPGPFSPHRISGDAGNGVSWTLTMVVSATSYDSVWLSSEMVNNSDRRIRFEPKGEPVLELAQGVRIVGRCGVSPGAGLQRVSLNHSPRPGEVMHSCRLDLRAFFGKLGPGSYGVTVIWPEGTYRIAGSAARPTGEMRSPRHAFHVVETSPQAAIDKTPPAYRLIRRLDAVNPITAGPLPRGRITNSHTEQSLYIPYYDHGADADGNDAVPAPLTAALGLVRWGGIGFEQVKIVSSMELPRYRLGPGESVTVALPDWETDGDGIYLYRLDVFHAQGRGAAGLLGQAYSEPFVVDRAAAGGDRGARP